MFLSILSLLVSIPLAIWVYSDASKRGHSKILWPLAILIFQLLGFIIYMIHRTMTSLYIETYMNAPRRGRRYSAPFERSSFLSAYPIYGPRGTIVRRRL
jgi:hypothetical protein